MNILDTILDHCRNIDCNCLPWRVDGDAPIHLPPTDALNIYGSGSGPYDVACFPTVQSFRAAMVWRDFLGEMQPYGKISVLASPDERHLMVPTSNLPNGGSIQLINERAVGDRLHCVFRVPRTLPSPPWDGHSDGTILVCSGVGFGDDFFFARSIPWQKNGNRRFIFEARAEEASFMRRCSHYDDVCVKGEQLPPHDFHWEVGEQITRVPRRLLPLLDRSSLKPEPLEGRIRAGLVLRGHYVKIGPKREVPLSCIADAPRWVRFYLLHRADHRGVVDLPDNVVDLSGELGSWLDTANFLTSLDCVVSVDTSVVHLAAALGVPVKVVLERGHSNFYLSAGDRRCEWYGRGVEAHWGDPRRSMRQILSGFIGRS